MPFSINTFKSIISQTDFARPSLFNVFVTTPTGVPSILPVSAFLIRAASLPGSNIGVIPVPYGGRTVKIAGERSYNDWSTGIMNDEGFVIRNAMEDWIELMNNRVSNFRSFPSEYKVDLTVTQYSKKGPPIKIVKLIGCFPTSISEIGLDWGQSDSIEEYTVNWAYDNWE